MKYKAILIILVIGVVTLLSACQRGANTNPGSTATPISISSTPQNSVASPPSPSSPSVSQQILAKVISAMSQVNSFGLDSDVIDSRYVQQKSEEDRSVIRWKGNKSMDIQNKEMQMATIIDNSDSSGNFGRYTINISFDKGYIYEQAWTPGAGNTGGVWYKSKFNEDLWNSESQIPAILELLKSTDQPILLGSEKVNNLNCYVLNIIPSAEAIASWVVSQQQVPGPSLTTSFGGPALVGKDMFAKAYKSGIFQIWIDSESYYLVKASFNPHFEATATDLSQFWGQQSSIENITSDFISQISFSGYNQPIDIQLPVEAVNAQEQ